MRPTSGDYETREGSRPFIEDYLLHLPDAFDRYRDIDGIDVYRAAAAHAAAHIECTRQTISAAGLTPTQQCFIDLFEDARIEYLAYQRFPGLRRLWLRFFEYALDDAEADYHKVVLQMLRIGRSLLDSGYQDDATWLRQTTAGFRAELERDPGNISTVCEYGLKCHELISQSDTMPSVRILQDLPIRYRDDNRYLWAFDENRFADSEFEQAPWRQPTLRKRVSLMEMVNEIDSELEDGSPQEIWTLPTELFPYEDHGVSYNAAEGVEPLSEPFHYDEWDYQVQLARPEWTTVVERRQLPADAETMDLILQKHKPLASRIKHLIDALQPQGVVR